MIVRFIYFIVSINIFDVYFRPLRFELDIHMTVFYSNLCLNK